jgi:hydrogenase/urease accessory protein HupE
MLLTALLLLPALSPVEGAHDEKVVVVDLKVGGREAQLLLQVGMERLRAKVAFPAEPLDLTELQLRSKTDEVARAVRAMVKVEVDGAPAELEADVLEPQFEKFAGVGEDFIASVLQGYTIRAAKPIRRVSIAFDVFADLPGTSVLLKAAWDGERRVFRRAGPEPLVLEAGELRPSAWVTMRDFVLWGMKHIFVGFDHIAFLLALLLGARQLKEMVLVITSFTVAHSVTLALAAFGKFDWIPSRVTESMIAASIVYVAVENLACPRARHRWVLTFLFGLVHGLGFSGVLADYLEGTDSLLLSVLSFNVGVELGQLAILALAFPLLAGLRRRREAEPDSRPPVLVAGSLLAGLFGLAWMIDRVFALEMMPI